MDVRPSRELRAKLRLATALPVLVGGFIGLKKGEEKLVPTILATATIVVDCYYAIKLLRGGEAEQE